MKRLPERNGIKHAPPHVAYQKESEKRKRGRYVTRTFEMIETKPFICRFDLPQKEVNPPRHALEQLQRVLDLRLEFVRARLISRSDSVASGETLQHSPDKRSCVSPPLLLFCCLSFLRPRVQW